MSGNKESYDLICSLGGNCSAAHNLRYRNLRVDAYPFDWTYFSSDKAVEMLIEGFEKNFVNYMQKDNLKLLPKNIEHVNKYQYEDTYGHLVWANHFSKKIANERYFLKIKKKYEQRFERLINKIKKSRKILFIFSVNYETDMKIYLKLLSSLKNLYPNKDFYIKILAFNCCVDVILNEETVELRKYKRDMNNYDFTKTNFEWKFLDDVKISSCNNKLVRFYRTKNFVQILVFENLKKIFELKLLLCGKILKFSIGKGE